MPVEIKVPSAGESVSQGVLTRWLRKDGESVRRDEPVAEMETDKASGEIFAPATGRLRIGVQEGQTVLVGAVIGRIEEGSAPAPAPAAQPPRKSEPAKPAAPAPAPRADGAALSPAA